MHPTRDSVLRKELQSQYTPSNARVDYIGSLYILMYFLPA